MNLERMIVLVLFSFSAYGADLYEYNRPVRALGMGNVYLTFVKDTDAPTLNPAALGFVSGISLEIINLGVGLNGYESLSSYRQTNSVSNASDYDQFFGKKVWVGGNGRLALTLPNFGVSVYDDAKVSLILRNTAFPNMDMTFFNDYGLVVAGALPIAPLTSLGIAFKRISRWGGYQTVGLSTIATGNSAALQNEFENKGVGYGSDIALMTKLPGLLSPSFAVVWQDVGSTAFTKTTGNDAPPRIKDNLQAGVGVNLDLPGIDLSAGVEYRHINDLGVQIGKKLHTGVELSLPLIELRAGSSQGYSTFGAGFSFLFLNFDAAMFKTEAGEYPGQSPEDRLLLSLSIDLSVDANFNFYSKDGKKRSLKQRR
ncbi:MAG: hypothetical protein JNL11_08780 [Bdellovibrionaceae bacterium]|nr:hypothetical protein [Pseudobdellovibrionaceae bacterium]